METEEIPASEPHCSSTRGETSSNGEYELLLYPLENEFIGKIIVHHSIETKKSKTKNSSLATIVVLDRSSSMGNSVARFVNIVLPMLFTKLQYSLDDIIYLITFDSHSEVIKSSVELLSVLPVFDKGSTYMANAIDLLRSILVNDLKDQHAVRLLTISDGEIFDQDEAQKAATRLMQEIDQKLEINSQAVRLFTSCMQPDTKAVSCLLQLNNMTKVNLMDLSTELSHEEICTAIYDLFNEDGLTYQISLESDENIIKRSPWLTQFSNKLTLTPGENIFWLQKIPTGQLTIENSKVKVEVQPEINFQIYEKLLGKKISHYLTQLKILKVVGTKESIATISNMVSYFQKSENYLLNKEIDVQVILKNPSLQSRLDYLKTMIDRRSKAISMHMSQIANDEKVSQLNSAQQAEYLRTIDTSKNSRGLARRAATHGIDFNETVRKEVKVMCKHVHELKDIDAKDHTESFYSRETTLGGIRAVCELAKENLLEDLDVNEILLMINIVGIACTAQIGDYPDPMTWRVKDLHLGWYVSLSDVLMSVVLSKDYVLKTPGTEKEITNVIPIFDDNKIIQFFRKYAPSLLEYTCSVGMRRIIADIPMTCGYTICAAVWKMIEELNNKKSELHLKTFEKLIQNYKYYVGTYFEHILPYIKQQETNHNSYYIANNGITNMISPLITLYHLNDPTKLVYVPDILRALYTYEVWQAIRRQYKNQEKSDTVIKDMLTKLLGIDLEKNKTALAPMYEKEPELSKIQFYDKINLNESYLHELTKSFYYIRYMTLIPKYFQAVLTKQTKEICNVPSLTEDYICKELDVSYDLKTFNLYNIVQALLFTTKASRVDTEQESMKILDLKYKEDANKMVTEYIRKQFENHYQTELNKKKRTEEAELVTVLVESIVKADRHDEVVNLMRNGVTRGVVQQQIVNSSSLGFIDLKRKLLNKEEDIPLRLNIIRLFLLGRDYINNDEPVWNNGGVTIVYNLSEFAEIFQSSGHSEEWELIHTEYKARGTHIYREKVNYHGHSNAKPSFYAFGYLSLQHYMKDVSDSEFKNYCSEHVKCCGVPRLLKLLESK